MIRGLIFFGFVVFALLGCLAAAKPGASGHPLLVESAARPADASSPPAWRLLTLCPTGRRNVPVIPDERSA